MPLHAASRAALAPDAPLARLAAGRPTGGKRAASSSSGSAPNSDSYPARSSVSEATRWATARRSPPISASFSIGESAWDQSVSFRPSQKSQRRYATLSSEGVRLLPFAIPSLTGLPSVNAWGGTWHDAQEK